MQILSSIIISYGCHTQWVVTCRERRLNVDEPDKSCASKPFGPWYLRVDDDEETTGSAGENRPKTVTR